MACPTQSATPEYTEIESENGGYLMIELLRVERFRCFSSIELQNLKRINVIVGDNASGKTVLLEAIKLALGAGPQIVGFLNQLRGVQPFFLPNPSGEQFKSYFRDIFHNFHDESKIEFSVLDSKKRNASLSIYFDPEHAVTSQGPQANAAIGFQSPASGAVASPVTTITPLAFDRVDFGGNKSSFYATVQNGNVLLQPAPELGINSSFFSSGYPANPIENAVWLSQLSVKKESDQISAAMRRHFPFVRSLSSETPLPGIPSVYADVADIPQKLPLSHVSWGINRVLTFVLATTSYPNGVVLIDEIENGVYHKQYESLWKTLFDLAEEHDAQIFVSTHSDECLRAALSTVRGNEEKFTLLRTERKDGVYSTTRIDGKMFESALEQGFDPR